MVRSAHFVCGPPAVAGKPDLKNLRVRPMVTWMSGYLGQDSWDSPTPEVAATEFHIAGIPVRVE
jgi:hypothetical protein